MPTKKPQRRKRYQNQKFLKSLGAHCKRLRIVKGYSIDRLAKEGILLSPATIFRLEQGDSDVQITVLLRIAAVLDVDLTELFAFSFELPVD